LSRILWVSLLSLAVFHEAFSQERNRIALLAREASYKGLTTVVDPTRLFVMPLVTMSLKDALEGGCSPMLLEIMRKRSGLTRDGNRILTWYEARVLDALGAKIPDRIDSDAGHLVPLEMRDLPRSSIFVVTDRGAVSIDGVLVQEPAGSSPLSIGGRYLAFVEFEDNPDGTFRRVARIPLDYRGIFSYDQQADTFTPLTVHLQDPFVQDLLGRSAGSFKELLGSIRRAVNAH
jgi:hypothetical protein